ncbi:glycoside hydrolase family 30 protein [Paenibacillus cremeus]|uniref:Glucosylceramidase n=1 Tax=Paenibacillus cremeus TaxID=2163881 RepID=A0A559K0L7_9BACL|nr:glycoside hydrolase family 30 beta sandwich domain-containing protein [Paenibacillus cremeus]TVY05678.1 glucosylceramidase [Paenibacillus cremeus]
MKMITTTYDGKVKKTTERDVQWIQDDISVENRVVNIYPQVEFQEIIGFGGAFTEASGYVLSKMSEKSRHEIIESYFGSSGIGYTTCRLHLDSCDFALGNYSAITDPNDFELKTFSLARDEEYILPLVRMAQQNGKEELQFLLSPWSPPAFMKTNKQKNGGGKLLPEYRTMWGQYMAKYVKAYWDMGINITMLSVQNEANATQKWDSCVYSGQEEMEFVRDYLGPAMEEAGAHDVQILVWDHNKERVFERMSEALADKEADKYVGGVAFHWYSGDHFEAVALVSRCFPGKKLIFSEGAFEYIPSEGIDQLDHAQAYAHQMIGNFNAGMHAAMDWNLALDKDGGPNHVNNLAIAPIMCDVQNDMYEVQLSHTYLGHFSKYIRPGAKRIGHSTYRGDLEVTAFKNPDGSIAAVVLNRTKNDIRYRLRFCGKLADELIANKESITTLLIQEQH